MIDAALSDKEWKALNHFQDNASHGPYINHSVIIRGPEDKFRGPIAPGADIWQIGLFGQNLSRAKITDNNLLALNEHIMGFNIPMTNPQLMYIMQPPPDLISNELNVKHPKRFPAQISKQIPLIVVHNNAQVLIAHLLAGIGANNLN